MQDGLKRAPHIGRNDINPAATIEALIPGMNYFAFWYLIGALAIWLIGIETRGRHDRRDRCGNVGDAARADGARIVAE